VSFTRGFSKANLQSFFERRQIAVTALVAGFLALASPGRGADLALPVTGNLLGSVVTGTGTPQMGASVLLFNKYERLVARSLTSNDGRFAFAGLPSDTYSLRVTLPSFLPAFRDRIAVKAGLDSILQIHLATLFSSVEVSYTLPTGAMSEDWKWVLRSSPATRPITRFLPGELAADTSESDTLRPRIFSGTHAMLSVSGGDGALIDSDSGLSDSGTQFALSTRLLGKDQLEVAGTYGQNGDFSPSAFGLCAIYTRNPDGGFGNMPEVTLTISQSSRFGPQVSGGGFNGSGGAASPALRSMSLSMYEVADPLDNVHAEYGVTGESVDYLQQHAMRVSPFARIRAELGQVGELVVSYNDGGRPDELIAHQEYQAVEAEDPGGDLMSAVNAVARLPQISNRGGQLELQRTQSYEIGFNKHTGSRTYAVSAFSERVSNGRLDLTGNLTSLDSGDLLFDGVSKLSTYNIGSYKRSGYVVSADQRLNDLVHVTLAYGQLGGFGSGGYGPGLILKESNRNAATVNLSAKTPVSGTRITAGYGWIETGSIVPAHLFTTQSTSLGPGLNFGIRQPLPSFFGMPGHLELTADLRNLLAQGYVPFAVPDGQRVLVVQSPRAIRGGLKFTF
jgi:Carboxypeptidase regulatory-like domain